MPHRSELKVRFYELDPYDHVNHTSYFGYFETARVEALERIGWGLHRLKEDGLQLVVSEMTARFLQPAVAGDVLTISSQVIEVGRASSVWRQQMERDGRSIATLELRVAITGRNGRPCRIPAGMAGALETLRA